MITPRETFKKNPDYSKRWLDMVDSTMFRDAAYAAMLQMANDLRNQPDMGNAAAAHWKMGGAQQFLETFMGLTLPGPVRRSQLPTNLNHNVE